jgi:4-hydroxy-tetrahydrodipicolinate synthase
VAAGARGGVLVSATLLPRTLMAIHDTAAAGRTADALRMHRELFGLFKLLFAETNPGPMKSVLDVIGVGARRMLAPLLQADPGLESALRGELARLLAREQAA